MVHVVQPFVCPGVRCATSKPYFVAIVQHAIHFGWWIKKIRAVAILKIGLAAGFHHRYVGIHYHVPRSGHLLDLCAASVVIPVRVTD
jgi:hypothetical protein